MKPRRALVAVAATTLLGSLAGTASAHSASHSTHVVYHYTSNGHTVVVKVGHSFKVSLEACGDCGDDWSFAKRPSSDNLKQTGHKTVSEAAPGTVGGNDREVWTFKALRNGKTTMHLVERSAEKSHHVIKRFSLTVKVPETLVVD